ncbi:hypothetical protein N7539_002707 [Penicillium diatomitis]|uniref:HIG1 domain-containing protein n=1 Tax=Penicillium diatomitis TaxID=2819901 RepID=A0A9X0BYW2_9EURO|nr:uncharacterized protein N7539_002707 [Penicillium diatomitis]KAJ5491140.1 hypothetical protein N7539_002707 [Penicillium diatomitis]
MKLLTKEEEDAHYRNVVKGGTIGGIVGLMAGSAGVLLASRRYHTIRNLTIPMKAFLVTSSGTFVGIIAADHASREFEKSQNAAKQWYESREDRLHAEEMRGLSFTDRALAFARREKYKIVGATWVASMIGSFVLVGRNPYLSGQQKIVQARVYAQGLTLAVLCASAAFEISDQRRGKGILDSAKKSKKSQVEDAAEPAPVHSQNNEQADLWKDMVAAEEQRLKSKHQSLHIHHDDNKDEAENKDESSEKSKDESEGEAKENKKDASSGKKNEGEKKA